MSRMWPASGPLVLPAVRGGIGYRCGCLPSYGESCPRCDGTGADEWEVRKAHRAPAGRRMSTAELWALIEACRPTHTDTPGDAA